MYKGDASDDEREIWVQPEDKRESLKAGPHNGAESRPLRISASDSRC